MKHLLGLSSVDFRLRIVLGNRRNRNKISQVSTYFSGAPALAKWAQTLLSQSSAKLFAKSSAKTEPADKFPILKSPRLDEQSKSIFEKE